MLPNVGPSHTEGVANRRFYIVFIKFRERCWSHLCKTPDISGVGPHPGWFMDDFHEIHVVLHDICSSHTRNAEAMPKMTPRHSKINF